MSYHTAAVLAIALVAAWLPAQLWIDRRCRQRAAWAEIENYLRERRP